MQTENKGLNLLKKGQKGILHAVFSRFGLLLLLLVVQFLILFGIFLRFKEFLPHIYGGTALFSLVMVVYLLNSKINSTAKITWLIVIMLLPVFGLLLFLYTQSDIG
ncbi:MAG: PLD nuclease N-terminal domain-containing protein, partial [Lachnospiraceae bacterium]|nr:PLD nuclease N-terminal domain-containing protein [Lachnospiraceae bacterium]